ncbi:MAG: hypothetical protein FWD42_07725, partial [Solirubrobacterales bacterium]|nr:hypothetical protein [Solirubrobacterales bacterium]
MASPEWTRRGPRAAAFEGLHGRNKNVHLAGIWRGLEHACPRRRWGIQKEDSFRAERILKTKHATAAAQDRHPLE